MYMQMTVFVRDKDGNLIDSHTFCGPNEDVLRSALHAFKWAITLYRKDYDVTSTPIHLDFID